MRVVIRKWGNSAAVRIPAAIMEAAKLEMDAPLDMRAENGRIIIEPLQVHDYDLDELLAGITPENIHDEVDFGGPTGRESL